MLRINKFELLKKALLQITLPSRRLPEMRYCGTAPLRAIKNFLQNNAAEKAIVDGDVAGKIWLVVGQPKSASSVIGSMIGEVAYAQGLSKRGYADYMLPNRDSNLRYELVRSFPRGGVLKFHPLPIGSNIKVIKDLKVKVFLTTRHPADQLVAYLFHVKKSLIQDSPIVKNDLIVDPIYCNKAEIFSLNKEDALQHLIENGYLMKSIQFCADWLNLEKELDLCTLTYEEMVNSREKFLAKLEATTGTSIGLELKEKIDRIPAEYEKKPQDDLRSDKIGIYKDHFSERNIDSFNTMIEKISGCYHIEELQNLYGDSLHI